MGMKSRRTKTKRAANKAGAKGKSTATLTYQQRGEAAIKMRKQGKRWSEIAEALGFANSGACNNAAAKVAGGYDKLPKVKGARSRK